VIKASRCNFIQKNMSRAFYIGAVLVVVGFLVGTALDARFNKIGAGILLGLFIGATMEILAPRLKEKSKWLKQEADPPADG